MADEKSIQTCFLKDTKKKRAWRQRQVATSLFHHQCLFETTGMSWRLRLSALWSDLSPVIIQKYSDCFMSDTYFKYVMQHFEGILSYSWQVNKKIGRDHISLFSWEAFPNVYLRLCWHMPYPKYSQNVHFFCIYINKTFPIFWFEKHALFESPRSWIPKINYITVKTSCKIFMQVYLQTVGLVMMWQKLIGTIKTILLRAHNSVSFHWSAWTCRVLDETRTWRVQRRPSPGRTQHSS